MQLTKAKTDEYSTLERDDALTCLALGSGNPKRVNELLAEKEIGIPLGTIKKWAYGSERERYARIRMEVEHFRNTRLSDQIKANATLAAEVVDKSMSQLSDKLDDEEIDFKPKELSAVARDASVTLGIHVQRGEELEGKPNIRVAVDFNGLLNEAKELGLEWVEGEAEEEVPALEP